MILCIYIHGYSIYHWVEQVDELMIILSYKLADKMSHLTLNIFLGILSIGISSLEYYAHLSEWSQRCDSRPLHPPKLIGGV